jgi:CRISPR/Cas system CMR-associated protein Cmr5 small subunit
MASHARLKTVVAFYNEKVQKPLDKKDNKSNNRPDVKITESKQQNPANRRT